MLANLLKCDIILVVTDITLVSISAGIAQSVEHFTRNEGVVSSSLISGLIKTQFRFFGTAFFYGARRVPESVFRRFMWLRFPVEN